MAGKCSQQKVYLRILQHFKKIILNFISRKSPKKRFGRLHVGGSNKMIKKNFYWSIEPPQCVVGNISFLDKCLLICTIFGLFQNEYFRSGRKLKTFLYLKNCHSKFVQKRNYALNLLAKELQKLLTVSNLKQTGPYQVQATVEILHGSYKCQFFVFSGCSGKRRLKFMFPEEYDDSLIPIYLYSSSSEPTHLTYISNINSYFRANYRICFGCKKHFSKFDCRHLCPKRQSCFACRRFLMNSSTFVHEKLINSFCDKLVSTEKEFLCKICNCTLYSKHCFKGHKVFCNGVGHFGYKCTACNHFIYTQSKNTSNDLKENHVCTEQRTCRFCFCSIDENHLCTMNQIAMPNFHNRLIFFILALEETESDGFKLLFALFNKEKDERCNFVKILISQATSGLKQNSDEFYFNYFQPNTKNSDVTKPQSSRSKKVTQCFQSNVNNLEKEESLENQVILFFLTHQNSTFICQDIDGNIMVSCSIVSLKTMFNI